MVTGVTIHPPEPVGTQKRSPHVPRTLTAAQIGLRA